MKEPPVTLLVLKRKIAEQARTLCWVLALTLVAGLFIGGAQPIAVDLVPSPWDKLVHAAVFGLIAAFIAVASGLRGWRMVLLTVLSALLVGALDEWHQAFLPGRQAGFDDLAADGIGGLAAASLLHFSGFGAARKKERPA